MGFQIPIHTCTCTYEYLLILLCSLEDYSVSYFAGYLGYKCKKKINYYLNELFVNKNLNDKKQLQLGTYLIKNIFRLKIKVDYSLKPP